MYSQTIQTIGAQEPLWLQIVNFLRAIGQIFLVVGRALIQIGQIIYEFFSQ